MNLIGSITAAAILVAVFLAGRYGACQSADITSVQVSDTAVQYDRIISRLLPEKGTIHVQLEEVTDE